MDPADLFRSSLELIDDVASSVCHRAGMRGADAEDFAGDFRVALIADDYAVLRSYEGRASLGTYLTVIARRLLINQHRAEGRWHASSAAVQMSEAGVLLERAVRRDGRTIEEVLPLLQAIDPSITRDIALSMDAKLPARAPRARMTDLLEKHEESVAGSERGDIRVVESEARRLSRRASEAVKRLLGELDLEQRSILRLRFSAGMSVADISRALRIPQRPLYRLLDRLLQQIRGELQRAGINASSLTELIGGNVDLDFSLEERENPAVRPTNKASEVMTRPRNTTP